MLLFFGVEKRSGLDRCDVLCLRAFLTVGDGELHFLAISEGLEAIALDCAEVYEHVGAVFALDEAESLGLVKPLNGAGFCRHMCYLYNLGKPGSGLQGLVTIYVQRTEELKGTSTTRINTTDYSAPKSLAPGFAAGSCCSANILGNITRLRTLTGRACQWRAARTHEPGVGVGDDRDRCALQGGLQWAAIVKAGQKSALLQEGHYSRHDTPRQI